MLCHRMEKRFCFEWQTPGLGPLCAFGDFWSGPPGLVEPTARLVISGAGCRA